MSLKEQKIKERIEQGNRKAAFIAAYLNHRFGMDLTQTELHDDIKLKLDYKRENGQTFQMKVRDQREDIIHEAVKFKKADKPKTYRIEPGRDNQCKADFYVCKPKVFNPERIDITRTSDVKKLTEEALNEWAKSGESELSNENIHDWWKRASWSDSKQTFLFSSVEGTEIYNKIDEGSDTEPFSKLLSFVKAETLSKREDCYLRTIYLQEGENLYDPRTWKDYR